MNNTLKKILVVVFILAIGMLGILRIWTIASNYQVAYIENRNIEL